MTRGDYDSDLEFEASIAIDELFRIINKMGEGERVIIRVFEEKMLREHRTLIQAWWRVMSHVIGTYALTKEGWFDARNEDSIKWARQVASIKQFMSFI